MNKTSFAVSIAQVIALAVAATVPAATASAEPALAGRGFRASGQRQLTIALRPGRDSIDAWTAALRTDADLMAYRFRAIVPGAGEGSKVWTLRIASRFGGRELVRLDAPETDLVLARPWGVWLPAGDTVIVHLELSGQTAEADSVVVLIDCEVAERSPNRVAVYPAAAMRSDGVSGTSTSWTWTTPANGRLVAILGLDRRRVMHVAVTAMDTGEEVWSASLSGDGGAAAVRLGAAVRAGRAYRVTVTPERGSDVPAAHLVMLMVPVP